MCSKLSPQQADIGNWSLEIGNFLTTEGYQNTGEVLERKYQYVHAMTALKSPNNSGCIPGQKSTAFWKQICPRWLQNSLLNTICTLKITLVYIKHFMQEDWKIFYKFYTESLQVSLLKVGVKCSNSIQEFNTSVYKIQPVGWIWPTNWMDRQAVTNGLYLALMPPWCSTWGQALSTPAWHSLNFATLWPAPSLCPPDNTIPAQHSPHSFPVRLQLPGYCSASPVSSSCSSFSLPLLPLKFWWAARAAHMAGQQWHSLKKN